MNTPIRIAIVDPHEIVRMGLKCSFEDSLTIRLVGEASTAQDMLSLCGQATPDVILFDFAYQSEAIGVINQLHCQYPHIKVLVLTANLEADYALNAIQAGVNGYLFKKVNLDELEQAIVRVYNGQPVFDQEVEKFLPA
jgi:DNA-binding NarL/FixJ family response regulator